MRDIAQSIKDFEIRMAAENPSSDNVRLKTRSQTRRKNEMLKNDAMNRTNSSTRAHKKKAKNNK